MKGFRPDAAAVNESARLTSHRAYDELRRRILSAEIPPGAVVNEVALAESLGISRTPVREAFRELLNEGLLEGAGPRRQVTVRTVSADQVGEITSARRALENITTSAAATRITAPALDDLRLIVDRMTRAVRKSDLHAFLDADDEFHTAISSAADMPTIEEFLSRLRALTRLAASPTAVAGDSDLPDLHGEVVRLLASETGRRSRPAAALLSQCTELVTQR
jgi:DNA-binding GntR family transcriptional regulator